MRKSAINKAKKCCTKLREAVEALPKTENFDQFERVWVAILTEGNKVFSALDTGSKGDPKSEGWFSNIKGQRKNDELLRYMQEARHVEEHGIEEVTSMWHGDAMIPGGFIHNLVIHGDGSTSGASKDHIIRIGPPQINLVAVTSPRFGDTFSPPDHHLGKYLSDEETKIPALAKIYLGYVENLINEAEKRITG